MSSSPPTEYAAAPDEAARAQRLSQLKIDPASVTKTPLVVRAGQHFVLSAENPLARGWLKPFPEISTLEELKTFVGIPDQIHQTSDTPATLVFPDVDHTTLVASDVLDLRDSASTAYKVGVNLVYGPRPAAAHEGVDQLIAAMTGALRGQYLVVGGDLIVGAGAVIDLGPNPTVSFDRIIIHGDGAIITHNHQKVIASVIQWLPN